MTAPTVHQVPPTGAAVQARGLSRRFGSTVVLDGIDLDLVPGELVALVGENGAGKSTLIRGLAGVIDFDRGTVLVDGRPLEPTPAGVMGQGVAVVWQDLALCDNLDVVANLFLGQERRGFLLSDELMYHDARRLLLDLGIDMPDLGRPVGALSGGQRQAIAIARAVLRAPSVLLLDEPTAALGVKESRTVDALLRRLRGSGMTLLLVSHRMEQVFDLADRIIVLRHGRVVADVSPLESHPDDVIAMMSGVETDSTARKQLHRLHSLVDQLSDVEPAASLPLIVAAIATALDQPHVSVHLLETDATGRPVLVRAAAVGLAPSLLELTARVPADEAGGPVGEAAKLGRYVAVDDLRTDARVPELAAAARSGDVAAAWAMPILGTDGVLGVLSGWPPTPGRLHVDQLELVSVYAGQAAAAIERDRLIAEVSRRNRILETLRGVLETLAGPEHVRGGMEIALLALLRGLGAEALALFVAPEATETPDPLDPAAGAAAPGEPLDRSGEAASLELRAGIDLTALGHRVGPTAAATLRSAAGMILAGPPQLDRPRPVGGDTVGVPLPVPEGRGVLVAWWTDPTAISGDTLDLLADATRSVRLALERDALDQVNQETEALRRSHDHQRTFLSRVSHELRTPLTAIHGYASSLNQTDITWDEEVQHRFLDLIVSESGRMGRLVADLLDSSAIDSGVLRLQSDWCDLALIIDAAIACLPDPASVTLQIDPAVGPVWGDHDRLEQVFVNLLENAARHGDGPSGVVVAVQAGPNEVAIRVSDRGPGIPTDLTEAVFQAAVRGTTPAAGQGLGLAIARGIVDAHDGSIVVEPTPVGATLLVTLPIEPVASDHHAEPMSVPSDGAASGV